MENFYLLLIQYNPVFLDHEWLQKFFFFLRYFHLNCLYDKFN